MNNKQIEESIKRSIALDTPDLFEQIASTPVQKLPEEDYIVRSQRKERHGISKLQALYTACTSVALILMICFGFIHNYYSVDSIVAIDVNPSVEISLSKSYRVLSVRANNEDGEKLIKNKNFKNKSFDAVITELTTCLSSEGYINKDKNSILVSVSNANEVKADEVKSRVVTDIKTTLNEQEIEPVIYKQSISNSTTKKLEALAKKYHISFGKMQLIYSLIEKDPTLTIEELASLTIQEIPKYVEKRQIKMADVIECEDSSSVVAKENKAQIEKTSTSSKEESTSASEQNSTNSTATTVTTSTASNSTSELPSTEATQSTASSIMASEEGDTTTICTCPNCLTDKNCSKNCELCVPDCPNVGNKDSSTTNSSTATTNNNNKPDTNNNKPDKNKKPNKGDKDSTTTQTEQNSSTESNDIENSGSYEDSTEESTETSTDSSTEEDDISNSGEIDEPEETTEPELGNTDSEIIIEESNTTSMNTVSGSAILD